MQIAKKHVLDYPVLLFALLAGLLLYLSLFAPTTVTLDGYSHLYGGKALGWMLGGHSDVHNAFFYNSILLPNWICPLFLAALSTVVSNELALRLLIVLIGTALLLSLYSCIDAAQYHPRQRAQLLIILLPFALNAYLTLGFYGFLISSSMCIFALSLLLRHGLNMPLRLQFVTAVLLLAAYFSNPLPVLLSLLFPCIHLIADAGVQWGHGLRGSATALKRHALGIWPWVPPACLISWFYLRLARMGEPHAYSVAYRVKHRAMALATDALLSISPTPSVGTLFIALLSILLAGVLLHAPELFVRCRHRFTSIAMLVVSTMVLYLIVPDQVGDGTEIANRFLLYSGLFLVLLAVTGGVFDPRFLTLCSVVAALSVVGFAGEYLVVSRSLAPAVAELGVAMERVPRHSRILILGYRMTPSCRGWPLLDRSIPERHWALGSALGKELIVLNDYQAYSSVFPLKYSRMQSKALVNEVSLSSEWRTAAWSDVLKSDFDVDFVVSWGTPSIGAVPCPNPLSPPFDDVLRVGYDLVFSNKITSRVELWRRRS